MPYVAAAALAFGSAQESLFERPAYLDDCVRTPAQFSVPFAAHTLEYESVLYGCEPIGKPNRLYVRSDEGTMIFEVSAGVFGDSDQDTFEERLSGGAHYRIRDGTTEILVDGTFRTIENLESMLGESLAPIGPNPGTLPVIYEFLVSNSLAAFTSEWLEWIEGIGRSE